MAEGYMPDQHERQSEAYRLEMDRLEKQRTPQHRIVSKPFSKVRSILLAILACVIVAGLLLATAAVCMYPLSN